MNLSAKKQRNMTNLEVQAQNMVNETGSCGSDDDVEVVDATRFNQMVQQSKDRHIGESLFSFLERQVKDQMRTALRQPLCDVSSTVLNKMVSRDVAASLRKYKMNAGNGGNTQTPKRSKSNGARGDDLDDTQVRFNEGRGRSQENRRGNQSEEAMVPAMNNTIRGYLRELDTGISSKQSLLKMLVLKCDEADTNLNRLRNCMNSGQMDAADRILNDLQAKNGASLSSLQTEVTEGPDLLQTVGQLAATLSNESQRAKSASRCAVQSTLDNMKNRRDQTSPLRESRKSSLKPPSQGNVGESNERVNSLKRQIVDLNVECERLRQEMVNMSRAMDQKDDRVRQLERHLDSSPSRPAPQLEEEVGALRHESQSLKTENTMLRDKIHDLTNELDHLRHRAAMPDVAMEAENRRLKAELAEKQRETERQLVQIRELMHNQDRSASNNRNDWNDMYGKIKRESDDLKRDIRLLNQENERLVKQLEQARVAQSMVGTDKASSQNTAGDKDVARRLKKRELECQALWETLRDMYSSQRGVFDTKGMMEVLALRALDTKARRKLNI